MRLSTTLTRRLGIVTAAWGVVFAAVHLYWAAGGTMLSGPGTESLAASLYIVLIALIGLASGAIALGLYQPWGTRVGRSRLRLLARLGGTLLAFGVLVGVGGWIAAGSIGDDGAAGVVITAYFLLGALLFSALGWLADVLPRPDVMRATTPRRGGPGALHAGHDLS